MTESKSWKNPKFANWTLKILNWLIFQTWWPLFKMLRIPHHFNNNNFETSFPSSNKFFCDAFVMKVFYRKFLPRLQSLSACVERWSVILITVTSIGICTLLHREVLVFVDTRILHVCIGTNNPPRQISFPFQEHTRAKNMLTQSITEMQYTYTSTCTYYLYEIGKRIGVRAIM